MKLYDGFHARRLGSLQKGQFERVRVVKDDGGVLLTGENFSHYLKRGRGSVSTYTSFDLPTKLARFGYFLPQGVFAFAAVLAVFILNPTKIILSLFEAMEVALGAITYTDVSAARLEARMLIGNVLIGFFVAIWAWRLIAEMRPGRLNWQDGDVAIEISHWRHEQIGYLLYELEEPTDWHRAES